MNDSPSSMPVGAPPRPDGQALERGALLGAIANAIDHARVSQRSVAVLIVVLTRADRLDAMLGVPPLALMGEALARLPAALRPVDRFVQLSDEKLCVLLPNLKNGSQALLAATKLGQVLEAPFEIGGAATSVRPVVGVACFPHHAEIPEQLIVNADIAKRIARSRDMSQYVFQADDRREVDAYLGLESALRQALRTNQIEVHYQPQVRLDNGRCHAVEGLLRWTLPDHGLIAAPSIIRIAEANGLIGNLTTWVANTVIRHQAEWRHLGVDLQASLNLSTLNLVDTDLPDVLAQSIGTWGADPTKITLEITESGTIGDADKSLAVMKRIKDLGMRLSVDDFGTGYSSLSYVRRFPLDELKIDKMFVQHMRQSKADQAIVRSVIDLAHNFDLSVVAEGVEDDATFQDLKKKGCDLAQGYYMSPALPSEQLLLWLKQRH